MTLIDLQRALRQLCEGSTPWGVYPCPTCGLQRHDIDAVHCKACGTILNIPDEGIR